ncbi:hypothetical protein VTN00DRAFT_7395 [Thermoascus crustaceus]|uniref:uncharacterized protein n=1 Tax=Thermoascus crustaceus TaxID=5088 RepID=UPI00374302DA
MSSEETPQPPYPLHPSVASKLHPDYVAFYNQHVIDKQQVHYQPVEASRTGGVLIPGGGPVLEVGNVEDILIQRKHIEGFSPGESESEGPDIKVRVFTPKGDTPQGGWPAMLYFHGGGLAPENPFPAAVHDAWSSLLWLTSPSTQLKLSLNPTKLAIGGSSAGGNLAAVMTHKALLHNQNLPSPSESEPGLKPINIQIQLLSVPVTDNTATTAANPSYSTYEHTPALPAAKMLWYRRHYLPNESDWANPDASPLLYPAEDSHNHWSQLPPALIMVGELDVLRHEGEAYARKLQSAGVKDVDLVVMEGMPHPFLAMDGVLEAGRRAISLMCERLERVFWGE